MYELIHHEKYQPPREGTGEEKQQGRIEEVIEKVDELEIAENENIEQTSSNTG